MAVLVAFDRAAGLEPVLEGPGGLAEVVQQRGKRGEEVDCLQAVPVVLVCAAQDIAAGDVGGYRAFCVELARVADDPQMSVGTQ